MESHRMIMSEQVLFYVQMTKDEEFESWRIKFFDPQFITFSIYEEYFIFLQINVCIIPHIKKTIFLFPIKVFNQR